MADASFDTSVFPADVEIPAGLTADEDRGGQNAGVQMLQFSFCLLFAGRAWVSIPVAAPSPEGAAATMDQFVGQVLNPQLARMGYPPDICSWRAGACG